MKLLLLGAGGQLGSQLRRDLAALGEVTAHGRECDLADPQSLRDAVAASHCDVIVNAAAYTAVDRAESEPDAAYAVNARACEVLAREAQARGAWLVHYSTDYVFDGSGSRPWREDDPPAPLNVYGASKLAGENAIRAHCERHVILRTSWVFGSTGGNFLRSILAAAGERDTLTVVDDQWGAPTSVRLLSRVTTRIVPALQLSQAGLYHCAAAGYTSRLGFAAYALACALEQGMPLRARPESLRAIATADMPSPARRPLNSRLDTTRLRETFHVELPPWQDDVREAVAAIARMPQ